MSKCSDFPYLPSSFDPEEEILDQLSNRPGNQRCVVGRDELLLVVHEVPKAGVPEREPLIFWRRQDEVWMDYSGGRGLKRLGDLLDRYTKYIDEQEELVEAVDTAAGIFALARISGPLSRASRNLALAIEQTLQHDEDNRELRSYRDRARELERAAEQLNHDARLTMEFWMAERSEQQQEAAEKLNVTAFRLNLLAGFFLPLAAIGGIFGMNVAIPSFTQGLFWLILFGGLVTGGLVVWWVIRKSESCK
ncbi:CorA family divalent cation transporter [Haloferula sp. BvORR071]|uniref:CorA family divalent cation transporter n=1 Tax=Haloferula sp. BvORR071 TaxID=1396141 RepID=UPI00055959F0|nr:CorA family divalent cation transporter [Haloferula sp. BvORR071]